VAREQELPHLERTEIEVAAPDEECNRPRTAAQPGGLEVEKYRPSETR
jgi:hypothetical protein